MYNVVYMYSNVFLGEHWLQSTYNKGSENCMYFVSMQLSEYGINKLCCITELSITNSN